jgi:agmatine/peptidylarginine deiminase
MRKPDYAKVNSLFVTYPENFDHEYHELAPFFEGLISLCPDDITCFVIVNNENSARYIRRIFKNKDVKPIVVSGFYEVWLRDIMGFSCDDFVLKPKFKPDYCKDIYTEDYLRIIDKQTRYIISKTIDVPVKNCDLVWDGGNLGTNGKQAFVIDKIVKDNPTIDLDVYFKNYLNLELVLLPQNKYDILGHTDGCLQFINSNTAAVSCLSGKENSYDQNYIKEIVENLKRSNVDLKRTDDFISIDVQNGICSSRGIHVNFLQLNEQLIYPWYNNKSVNIEQRLGSSFNVLKRINSNKISELGGSLHCISFTC